MGTKASDSLSLGKDPKFLCGVAVSVYQNSGDPNAQWTYFQEQKQAHINLRLRLSPGKMTDWNEPGTAEGTVVEAKLPKLGPSKIVKNTRIGVASDFWNRYEQDIQLSKDIGCNSFRLSLEWSRLFPRRGELNQDAVDRYNAIFDTLERQGMEPHVTLQWFVHPQWFQELGAFANEENIPIFVDWCETAFKLFGKRSKLWTTFNEPGVAAMCGYIVGNHPPGKLLHFREAGIYLRNELRAHAAVYKAIKALPGGKEVAVGICHNVFWTEPKRGGPLYAHVRAAVGIGNRIWGNETVMTFLKTGIYKYWVPLGGVIHYEDPDGKPGCDFMGVNHYARGVVGFFLNPTNKGPKGIADMGYPVYPPSLYRAVSYASTLGVPVYILENGMPCREDDDRRKEWIDGCLAEVEKLIDDGYDVRGYFYWTLVDNFEWNFAWELKFGLYEWNDDGTQRRTLRNGAKTIKTWYKLMPEALGKKLAARRKRGGAMDEESRQEREQQTEEEYLRKEGFSEEQVEEFVSQDSNPIVTGVY
ncbi:g10984 [Coccomyxa elongata]